MKLINKIGAVLITSAMLLSSANMANAAPASTQTPEAQENSESCEYTFGICTTTKITNGKRAYVPSEERIYGSSGANVTLAKGHSATSTGTISAGTTIKAGAIFASASVELGISLSLSKTNTMTYSVSATIPNNGDYIQLGSEGRSFNWATTTYIHGVPVSTETGSALGASEHPYAYLSWVGYK